MDIMWQNGRMDIMAAFCSSYLRFCRFKHYFIHQITVQSPEKWTGQIESIIGLRCRQKSHPEGKRIMETRFTEFPALFVIPKCGNSRPALEIDD